MFNGLSLAAKSFHACRRLVLRARRAWRARQLEPATGQKCQARGATSKTICTLTRGSRFSPRASVAIAVRGPSGAFNHFGERAARIYAGVMYASELNALVVRREALARRERRNRTEAPGAAAQQTAVPSIPWAKTLCPPEGAHYNPGA